MLLSYVYVAGGLIALFSGGEALLRGAVSLARRFGLPELLIGLTVVGFGTSMPELLVSLEAALGGQSEIALGNVVGSNTANILLIGGLSALIYPMRNWDSAVRRDVVVMVAVSAVALFLAWSGELTRFNGAVLLVLLAAYLVYAWLDQQGIGAPPGGDEAVADRLAVAIAFIVSGFLLLFFGANYLVEGATAIARHHGISEAVIGLTIVAVGTSLPELATSVIAALRRNSDIAIGNIVGSNIFNILGILGVTALVAPMQVSGNFLSLDIPFMLGVAVAFAVVLVFLNSIGRIMALAMIAAYVSYVWIQFAG